MVFQGTVQKKYQMESSNGQSDLAQELPQTSQLECCSPVNDERTVSASVPIGMFPERSQSSVAIAHVAPLQKGKTLADNARKISSHAGQTSLVYADRSNPLLVNDRVQGPSNYLQYPTLQACEDWIGARQSFQTSQQYSTLVENLAKFVRVNSLLQDRDSNLQLNEGKRGIHVSGNHVNELLGMETVNSVARNSADNRLGDMNAQQSSVLVSFLQEKATNSNSEERNKPPQRNLPLLSHQHFEYQSTMPPITSAQQSQYWSTTVFGQTSHDERAVINSSNKIVQNASTSDRNAVRLVAGVCSDEKLFKPKLRKKVLAHANRKPQTMTNVAESRTSLKQIETTVVQQQSSVHNDPGPPKIFSVSLKTAMTVSPVPNVDTNEIPLTEISVLPSRYIELKSSKTRPLNMPEQSRFVRPSQTHISNVAERNVAEFWVPDPEVWRQEREIRKRQQDFCATKFDETCGSKEFVETEGSSKVFASNQTCSNRTKSSGMGPRDNTVTGADDRRMVSSVESTLQPRIPPYCRSERSSPMDPEPLSNRSMCNVRAVPLVSSKESKASEGENSFKSDSLPSIVSVFSLKDTNNSDDIAAETTLKDCCEIDRDVGIMELKISPHHKESGSRKKMEMMSVSVTECSGEDNSSGTTRNAESISANSSGSYSRSMQNCRNFDKVTPKETQFMTELVESSELSGAGLKKNDCDGRKRNSIIHLPDIPQSSKSKDATNPHDCRSECGNSLTENANGKTKNVDTRPDLMLHYSKPLSTLNCEGHGEVSENIKLNGPSLLSFKNKFFRNKPKCLKLAPGVWSITSKPKNGITLGISAGNMLPETQHTQTCEGREKYHHKRSWTKNHAQHTSDLSGNCNTNEPRSKRIKVGFECRGEPIPKGSSIEKPEEDSTSVGALHCKTTEEVNTNSANTNLEKDGIQPTSSIHNSQSSLPLKVASMSNTYHAKNFVFSVVPSAGNQDISGNACQHHEKSGDSDKENGTVYVNFDQEAHSTDKKKLCSKFLTEQKTDPRKDLPSQEKIDHPRSGQMLTIPKLIIRKEWKSCLTPSSPQAKAALQSDRCTSSLPLRESPEIKLNDCTDDDESTSLNPPATITEKRTRARMGNWTPKSFSNGIAKIVSTKIRNKYIPKPSQEERNRNIFSAMESLTSMGLLNDECTQLPSSVENLAIQHRPELVLSSKIANTYEEPGAAEEGRRSAKEIDELHSFYGPPMCYTEEELIRQIGVSKSASLFKDAVKHSNDANEDDDAGQQLASSAQVPKRQHRSDVRKEVHWFSRENVCLKQCYVKVERINIKKKTVKIHLNREKHTGLRR